MMSEGCKTCDPNHLDYVYEDGIWYDEDDVCHYLNIETCEWDAWNDCYFVVRVEVTYCPHCGRKLG